MCLFDMRSRRCVPILAPSSDHRWTEYNSVVRIPDHSGQLRLYAYADAPEALGLAAAPPTVAEYRDISVRTLSPYASGRVEPAALVARTVDVGKSGRVGVHGPVRGNVLGSWSPLGDCHRYDGRSASDAGLGSTATSDGVELAASAHSACVSAPIEHLDVSSTLEISFRYRAIRGERLAHACVYDPLRGWCLQLEPADGSPITRGASLQTSTFVRTFRARAQVPAGTTSLRLYLYADGAAPGADPVETRIRYEDVVVRPVAPLVLVVVDSTVLSVPRRLTQQPRSTTWTSPASFHTNIETGGGPAIVASHESADRGWVLRSDEVMARPVTVQGYRSGWLLLPSASRVANLYAGYRPAQITRWTLAAAAAAAAVAVILTFFSAVKGRAARRRRKRENDEYGVNAAA
jgi:hypothetical protein